MLAKKIKNGLRKSRHLEALSYLIQNNMLAKALNFSGEGNFDRSVQGLYDHGIKIGQQYLDNASHAVAGKTVLEIGCGLSLATAYYLVAVGGARRVFAYDWFRCRHENDEAVVRQFDLTRHGTNVNYITGDYQALLQGIPAGQVDLVLSNAVLEHVADLPALFTVLGELLSPNGAMYHRVDLRCHNRFKRCGELYFHTFSEKLWNAMGNRVGQPNRWLLGDYERLFHDHGFEWEFKNVQHFSDDVLSDAVVYLNGRDVAEFKTAVFDVLLERNVEVRIV